MKNIIEFKNVNKTYNEISVLKNFNLSIEEGEFLTVIGSSGCGKTTLLKLINGLIKEDSGEVLVNGEKINKNNIINLRRNMGYVVQSIGLFPHMTIEKNLTYTLDLEKKLNKEEKSNRVKEILNIIGLGENILKRYPRELSGGQCQRVGIGRALGNKPAILLMDEPFGAVDEINRGLLQEALSKIYKASNVTVVFITHDIREALKLGTKVLVMNKGNIIQIGTPKEIKEKPKTDFVKNLIK